MTETPDGTHPPQHPTTPPQPQHPGPEPPYAGDEWRRPAEDPTAPSAVPVGDAVAGPAPSAGPDPVPPGGWQPGSGVGPHGQQPGPAAGPWTQRPWQQRPEAGSPEQAAGGPREQEARQPGYGVTSPPPGAHGGHAGPGGQWAYGAGTGSAVAERPGRTGAGKRLIAVGALTAVLGGLAGGGVVAAFDRDSTTVASAGLSRDTSSAPTAASTTSSVEAAAATALKSVVTINVTGGQESGTGSGVIIRADGYILTNQHVIAVAGNGGSITVMLPDGRTVPASVVGEDSVTDLAVVKVNVTGLQAATFADSDAVKIGQTVVAVGSPLGLNGTVTEGIVSALHRPTTGGSDNSAVIDALQTDAAINPGNSGGPLVDLAGRVVGINQSIATASSGGFGQSSGSGNIGIGFAIPSNTAQSVAQQLITTGRAVHAYLGVQVGGSGQQQATGATIASVESGGPAAAAGLRAGDVVTKIDSRIITSSADLVAAVRSYAPGDKVTLTIQRGGETRTVTVTLGSDAKQ